MLETKQQKAVLKEALQNEVRPHVVALKEVVKESNKLLKEIKEKEYPKQIATDLQPLIAGIKTLTEEVKKKEEYTYEIKVDADLKRKLTGKQGIRGARGLRGLQGKEGKAGHSPVIDIKAIIKQSTPKKGVDYFDGEKGEKGKDGNKITAEEVRDKLESLKGKSRLKISAIKGLEDALKKLDATISKSFNGFAGGGNGGGTGSGGTANNFADSEIPTGTINGVNVTFTLLHTPITGTVHLYYNGLRQTPVSDYTISGTTLTLVSAPIPTDVLLADYQY